MIRKFTDALKRIFARKQPSTVDERAWPYLRNITPKLTARTRSGLLGAHIIGQAEHIYTIGKFRVRK